MPKPLPPTIRDETVARQIAKRIVATVNLDEFYWLAEEIDDRVLDVQWEIMRCGRPATVFSRLERRQPLASCRGDRVTHPYGWEGIDEHCRNIGDEIAQSVLNEARKQYRDRYE
jgi:hypothetical protein